MTHPTAPPSDSSRWLALVVLCAGMLMIVLDQTIVNVALPSIQHDLGFGQSSLAWVVNAYLIAFGGLLLLAGRLGDLIGRRTIFLVGIAVFTAASALCGFAQSQVVLIAARFIQGAGGALTSSVILGMIITMFPERGEQARAIGVFSFVASAGASIGLLAGGALTQALSWHWIFFVNLPIGLLTALVARRLVRVRHRAGHPRGRRRAGRHPDHGCAHARRLRDREDLGLRLGVSAHARTRRAGHRPGGGLRGPGAPRPDAAHPARHLPLTRGDRSQPRADAVRLGDVRDVLPRRGLPPAGARLRATRRGPGLLARRLGHRRALAGRDAAPEHALRGPAHADPRAHPGHRGARAVRPRARAGELPRRHSGPDGAARARRRARLPLGDDDRHDRRAGDPVGAGLGPRQHLHAGRRRAGPGRPGHVVEHAHASPAGQRGNACARPDQRLSPRAGHRRRPARHVAEPRRPAPALGRPGRTRASVRDSTRGASTCSPIPTRSSACTRRRRRAWPRTPRPSSTGP